MIRTISGDFYSDTGFEERPWRYGDGSIQVFSGEADDTVIVQQDADSPITTPVTNTIAV